MSTLNLIPCPECGVPAEVTERFRLPSTDGPVDHLALACVTGHYFRMAVDMLPAQCQLALMTEERVSDAQENWASGQGGPARLAFRRQAD